MKRRRLSPPLLATLALATVAVAAGAFLWSSRGGTGAAGRATGGLLFAGSQAPTDALILNRGGLTYRFDRVAGGGWTLAGALVDDLDPQAMASLVDSLAAARGGPLLPGTEPEDRRYEFNGDGSLRLTLHREDGTSEDLALGTVNPVTGTRYASGAGRPVCFTVAAALRDRLAALPNSVRARTLAPGLDRGRVDRIVIDRDGQARVLARHDGQWWLLAPEDPAAFGPVAAEYQRLYGDRRRDDAEGRWLRASSRAVELFLFEIAEANVRQLAAPEQTAELVALWQLSPPWRRVTLRGAELRPALRGAPDESGTELSLAFGPRLDERTAPALRRGNVLAVESGALRTLEQPLGSLLDLNALPVDALTADAVTVTWEGRPLLRGSRSGEPGGGDGRQAWLSDDAAAPADGSGRERDRHGLVRDLMVNLGRQPIVRALPPSRDTDPLRQEGRDVLTLTYGTGASARTSSWELGWLRETSEGAAAAVWTRDSGQLLAIPDALLVTLRNAAQSAAPRR